MLRSLQLALVIPLVLLGALAWSQEPDRHITDPLCVRSAYIHGYIHGYERGFHTGDLEIHLGRAARPVSEFKEYSHSVGYRRAFGDSGYFNLGYQQGFRAAYADAMRGAAFRGIEQLRSVATGFPDFSGKKKELDQAIAIGYDEGYNEALRDSHLSDESRMASERCVAKRRHPVSCEVFVQGFRLGYADAAVNQLARETQSARK